MYIYTQTKNCKKKKEKSSINFRSENRFGSLLFYKTYRVLNTKTIKNTNKKSNLCKVLQLSALATNCTLSCI